MKKLCSKCHLEKDISEFYKDTRYENKYRAACKSCMYKSVNKEKSRKNSKKFRDTHKDEEKERLHKYYLENKEIINKKHLDYRNNNKEKIKKHYQENYEQIRQKQKEYNNKNREKINAKNREYYYNNMEMFAKKSKEFRETHKEYVRNYSREYHRNRREDEIERFKDNVRSLIYNSLHRNGFIKSQRTEEILGCDLDFFVKYIESKFHDGMSWERINEIHIDHIIPLATAKTKEEVIKLCHYTNLQPLWAKDNLSKGAKVNWKEKRKKTKQILRRRLWK